MGATQKANLFLRCRVVVSPHKTTSLTKITATAIFQNAARSPCELLEDLSDWLIAPERGNDLEIEPLSLWSRLRKETLTAEVQKEGWFGLFVEQREWTSDPLQLIHRIEFAMEDGAHGKHVVTVKSPWPEKTSHLVVAKHLRNRGL